jgi:hypothetical protein
MLSLSELVLHYTGTGCPEYPNFGVEGQFQDSPTSPLAPTTYITALACAERCCGATQRNHSYRRIVKIITIVVWHKGDQGSINDGHLTPPFSFADLNESATFFTALNRTYPHYKSCYECYHRPQY